MSQLDDIERKIDEIDKAIRGNGKPGINLRLDRLEQRYKSKARVLWNVLIPIAVAVVTAFVVKGF